MLNNTKNKIGLKIFLITIRFFVNYIKYFFLTGSVIFSLTILLFTILNINFLFNLFPDSQPIAVDIKNIIQIFLITSFALMIIINLIKIALKKIFKLINIFTLKIKIIIFITTITLSYVITLLIIAFSNNLDTGFYSDSLDNGLYFIFIIFYFINLISAMGYFLLDDLLNNISQIFKKKLQM